MMTPDYRALCAELLRALEYEGYAHWVITPDVDPLCQRARAALDQPEPEAPTDEELMAAARKAVDTYPRGSELSYFLHEDSSEYEPMLLALRAALAQPVAPTLYDATFISLRDTIAMLDQILTKEQALEILSAAGGPDFPQQMTVLNTDQHIIIKRALEQLND